MPPEVAIASKSPRTDAGVKRLTLPASNQSKVLSAHSPASTGCPNLVANERDTIAWAQFGQSTMADVRPSPYR
jgi:hypothetical protein